MNVPYTYLIGWSALDKWYYGVRYAKNCHPGDLWNPYKTSSRLVAKFILEHGEPDVVVVRRTFSDIKKAQLWEQRVLIRLHVVKDTRWINGHNTVAFDVSLVPKGLNHWTKKDPTKWKEIRERRSAQLTNKLIDGMPSGRDHWTNKNSNAAIKHNQRMLSDKNPNNFIHNKIKKSKRLKVDNPVNLPGVKDKIRETLTGYKHPRKTCEYCGKNVADSIYTRWHGYKCRNRIVD